MQNKKVRILAKGEPLDVTCNNCPRMVCFEPPNLSRPQASRPLKLKARKERNRLVGPRCMLARNMSCRVIVSCRVASCHVAPPANKHAIQFRALRTHRSVSCGSPSYTPRTHTPTSTHALMASFPLCFAVVTGGGQRLRRAREKKHRCCLRPKSKAENVPTELQCNCCKKKKERSEKKRLKGKGKERGGNEGERKKKGINN